MQIGKIYMSNTCFTDLQKGGTKKPMSLLLFVAGTAEAATSMVKFGEVLSLLSTQLPTMLVSGIVTLFIVCPVFLRAKLLGTMKLMFAIALLILEHLLSAKVLN